MVPRASQRIPSGIANRSLVAASFVRCNGEPPSRKIEAGQLIFVRLGSLRRGGLGFGMAAQILQAALQKSMKPIKSDDPHESGYCLRPGMESQIDEPAILIFGPLGLCSTLTGAFRA
jgi:hypothetical protein